MNGITILIWITIAIIGIIAIILVKLHYKGDELEHEEGSILPSSGSLNNILSTGQSIISNNINKNSSTQKRSNIPANLYKDNNQHSSGFDAYIVPEVENDNTATYEYKNENQVLVSYGNTYEKFQEPIKQNQMDIMTQNNDTKNEKTELKDLFTIDELIKESKRKDSEREKEAQTAKKEDEELSELKESIIRRKENPDLDDNLIEKIDEDGKEIKQESISDLVEEDEKETSEAAEEIGQSSIAPKDIEEAISTASKESEEENVESISESNNITDVLLENPDGGEEDDELKAPKKIDEERKDYKFGADLESGNVFGSTDNDLDYRKDLAKVKNTIRSSKIFQDVKERLTPEPRETPEDETYIRNVNEYEDEFAPIINETHADFEASYEEYHDPHFDERVRQENTRRVFTKAKNASSGLEIREPKIAEIKEKPVRENMKISLNNNEYVLKKGDEIIFNHQGETYSSQVYAIKGDDIYVRYRRKDITIKASDVKKIY